MQRVVVSVLRRRRYAAGDGFDVFWDGGSGTVDFSRPLNAVRVRFWPGAARRGGHLCDGHLMLPHVDSVWPDGHLEGTHLLDEHLWPAGLLRFETPEHYFGLLKLAVRSYDAAGNFCDEAGQVQVVVNSSPRPPSQARRSDYDAVADRLSIDFAASPDLTV